MITMDNSKRRKSVLIIWQNLAKTSLVQFMNKNKKITFQLLSGRPFIRFWNLVGATKDEGDYGCCGLDAHFDLHTFETSDSSNPHGMPVAGLMGYGDNRLTNILYNGIKLNLKMLLLLVQGATKAKREN